MNLDGSTPTSRGVGGDNYLQRRRHSIRLKRSPLTSPLPTTAVPSASGVIKFEPGSGLDENEDNKFQTRPGIHSELDDDDDDECMESEQPCDLRLSSQFKLNLVSMALQQAAMMSGNTAGPAVAGGSSGMAPASQLQHAALQTIAAVATQQQQHQAPGGHVLHHPGHAAAHHAALMNFPTHGGSVGVAIGAADSPRRRFSSSSSAGGGGANVTSAAGGPSASTTANIGGGGGGVGGGVPSTSAIVAPHTPSSTGSSGAAGGGGSGGGVGQGVTGPGSAGATGGPGGSGGSGGSGVSWGGAYTCDRCGNSYARPHSLNRHVRFECGVEPKFECPICHKKSKHKHNLVLHMRTHQHR